MDNPKSDLSKKLFTLRLIVTCVALGMIAFTVGAQFVPAPEDLLPATVITMVTAGAAFSTAFGYAVMRGSMIKAARQKFSPDDAEATSKLFTQAYFVPTLIGAAMAEGIGFLGIVASYITGENLLLIAPGVALVTMASIFPTAGSFAQRYESVTGDPLPTTDWPQ